MAGLEVGEAWGANALAIVDTVVRAAGSPLMRTSETEPVVVGDQVMVKA